MHIPFDKIETVFRKVHAVREEMKKYLLGGQYIELNPSNLAKTLSEMYGLKIAMHEVFASGKLVAGNVERYKDGSAVIMVKSQQSEAMVRLVATKELCHLMNDEKDDWSTAALDTIKEMKVEFDLAKANGEGVANPSRTQMSEMIALVGAVALLYPCEFHEPDRKKLSDNKTSFAKIALDHNMPAWAVEHAHDHSLLYQRYQNIVDTPAGVPKA